MNLSRTGLNWSKVLTGLSKPGKTKYSFSMISRKNYSKNKHNSVSMSDRSLSTVTVHKNSVKRPANDTDEKSVSEREEDWLSRVKSIIDAENNDTSFNSSNNPKPNKEFETSRNRFHVFKQLNPWKSKDDLAKFLKAQIIHQQGKIENTFNSYL